MFRNILIVCFLLFTAVVCASENQDEPRPQLQKSKSAYVEAMKGKVVTVIDVVPFSRRGQGGNQASGQLIGQVANSLGGVAMLPALVLGAGTEVGLDTIGGGKDKESAKEILVYGTYEPVAGEGTKKIHFPQSATPEIVQLKRGDQVVFIVNAESVLVLVPYRATQ